MLLKATLCNFDCQCCSLLFSRAVPNNDPLLQLQLQSAGSLHVAFRNLRKSELKQSSRRTSEGKPEDIFSVKYDPVLPKLLFCVTTTHH